MKTPEVDGDIGMDLTYCDGCGLESDDCKCDAAVVDEVLDGGEEDEE
jgi:hypothetical protein